MFLPFLLSIILLVLLDQTVISFPVPAKCPSEILKNTCQSCSDGCVVLSKFNSTNVEDCCAACGSNPACHAWTLNINENQCHLKTITTKSHEGSCTSGGIPVPSSKPNILFIMCDSMDGRVLDPTSPVSARVHMPNLRALAARGVNFIKTYAASPQCVPSRTTMFAGRHTHHIEAWSNGQGLAGIPSTGDLDTQCTTLYSVDTCRTWQKNQNVTATLVDSLRDVMYESHLYGKVDVGAGILADTDEKNATCNGFHSGPSLVILTRTADIRRATKKDPVSITNDKDNNVHPEDWKMMRKCVEFLKNLPNPQERKKKTPYGREYGGNWMLYCSINIPHPAFNTNDTWLSYVNLSAVTVPQWPKLEDFHPADSYQSISKNVWRNFTDEEIIKVRKTYYAMCAETDYILGQVLKALAQSGQQENTYVLFLSDHGENNMEHRQVWKNSMYEASERVPMIIAGPGITKGKVVHNLTSLLDVYPTLLQMAAPTGTLPGFLDGYSLFPLMSDKHSMSASTYPVDRAVISQYHSNMGNTGSFMLRKLNWKYIAFGNDGTIIKDYQPQLFDLSQDPEELHNVATQYPEVVTKLDKELRTVVNYPAVDARVKANDKALYKMYFVDKMTPEQLRKQFNAHYNGFDDNDMKKISKWLQA